jgi:hypothetical protein
MQSVEEVSGMRAINQPTKSNVINGGVDVGPDGREWYTIHTEHDVGRIVPWWHQCCPQFAANAASHVDTNVMRALIFTINGAFLCGGIAIFWSSWGMQTTINNSGLMCVDALFTSCCDRVGGTMRGSACLAECHVGFHYGYHLQVVAYFVYGIVFTVLGAVPWHKMSVNWDPYSTTSGAWLIACAMCAALSLYTILVVGYSIVFDDKCYVMGSDTPTSIPAFFRDRIPPVFWVVSCGAAAPWLVLIARLVYNCHQWLVAYVWFHFISS